MHHLWVEFIHKKLIKQQEAFFFKISIYCEKKILQEREERWATQRTRKKRGRNLAKTEGKEIPHPVKIA